MSYAIDAAIALPRILFSYELPSHPVVAQKIPLPRQIVLVNIACWAKCHELLISGAIEEVVFVERRRSDGAEEEPKAVRYRAGWSMPGACPRDRQKAIYFTDEGLLKTGYCPVVEPVEVPSQGIFLIRESTIVPAAERARSFAPAYLTKSPPGAVIEFVGIEVQNRTGSGVTVLASTYKYEAPGLLGLPPLLGCWERPDNVIWIMPPGDTGCGLWRRFTSGGDQQVSSDPKRLYEKIFEDVFGPPDRPIVPPKRPELPPPTPAQALEILSNGGDIEFHLPRLRDALLDPSNSDQALADLVARRARFGTLEGSLIALLAAKRPATLVGLSDRLDPMPRTFAKSGAVLDEMEKNPKFRDDFAETVFLALATRWETRDNIGRFLNLMETSHPGWLCERLPRFTGPDGIRRTRENGGMMNGALAMPPFMRPVVEKTAPRCPDATIDLLRALPRAPDLVLRFCQLQTTDGDPQGPSAKTKEFCRS